jgi:hypothetical protein
MQEKNIRYKGRRGVKAQNTERKGEGQVVLSRVLIRAVRRGVQCIEILFYRQIFE